MSCLKKCLGQEGSVAKAKHVAFDLDGTLVDSIPVMKVAWEASVSTLNIDCSFSEYKKYIGVPFPRILELLNLTIHSKK